MLLVGLTGNIGSGKTTAARLFEKLSVPVYHADDKGRQMLTLPGVIEKLCMLFGDSILDRKGQIDRHSLADIVFNDPEKLAQLNAIIHPLVRDDFRIWTNKQDQADYVIQEAAIIVETGQAGNFDKIILVTAPEELRIQRVCIRDGTDREKVIQRAQHQMNESEKAKVAHYIVVNDGTKALLPQVLEIHKELTQMALHRAKRAGKIK